MENSNNQMSAFDILGKKWNGEIISTFLDASKPLRFSELSAVLKTCSERVLAERLKELEMVGIINRISYPKTNRIDYALTETGLAMSNLMESIKNWEKRYL